MRERFLLDCGEFHKWLRRHLCIKLNYTIDEEAYLKLFSGLSYIIFNIRFDEILRTGYFSESEIEAITAEKERFNMVNSPTKCRAKDRKYAFYHEVTAFGKYIFDTEDNIKEVFFEKILGRKGTSVCTAKGDQGKNTEVRLFKENLEIFMEKISLSKILNDDHSSVDN